MFHLLNKRWGPFNVDCFASMRTAQIPIYRSNSNLQLTLQRPLHIRGGCIEPRLEKSKQFHQSTILSDPQGVKESTKGENRGSDNSSRLAKPAMVPLDEIDVKGQTSKNAQKSIFESVDKTRTQKKQQMQDLHLENIWHGKLSHAMGRCSD